MSRLSFSAVTPDVLHHVAEDIIRHFGESKIILFEGEMGSGKTTLIKEICAGMGVADSVSSPTYSLVNEYHTPQGDIIYHFDLYRLKNIEECFDVGIEEYLHSGHYCFIEWPGLIKELLPENYKSLRIEKESSDSRAIVFE